jgi:RNA polymerase-interacting CarD/CdnL/TRCF family regulator
MNRIKNKTTLPLNKCRIVFEKFIHVKNSQWNEPRREFYQLIKSTDIKSIAELGAGGSHL